MRSYRDGRNRYPFVAFLDVKAAYDTVNSRII
ncbi:hypothetical protein RO3G_06241 [Rhizopus delemar RA 99-880]|uniref:Reverse transcriptase domain-containing protein n=1 Tax=Rhizopus delemar (strain RA 99-880 / ATCC MYA-4621 / FGSC 9543 / NRRL 43880) TaxID=246409 RepID=I1BZA6_RHIO9|nr:hypothetical protein RO3G_06241 [Rhizopus delemar RA 99-880]|eukprot:EIE81536.1 hypothetical protein RO3G_06241 [Rhizopus delemar RA 99-880]